MQTAGERVWVSRSISSRGLAEAEVAELKDGRVLVVWRTSNAGLDPTPLGGHSLRAGLVTAAARSGKPEHAIMAQTGHQSSTRVRRHIREENLFECDDPVHPLNATGAEATA